VLLLLLPLLPLLLPHRKTAPGRGEIHRRRVVCCVNISRVAD